MPFTSLLSKHQIYSEMRLVFSLAPHRFLNPGGFCFGFCIFFFFFFAWCSCVRVSGWLLKCLWEARDFSLSSKPFCHPCPSFLTLLNPKCCAPSPAIVSSTKMGWLGCVKVLANLDIIFSCRISQLTLSLRCHLQLPYSHFERIQLWQQLSAGISATALPDLGRQSQCPLPSRW